MKRLLVIGLLLLPLLLLVSRTRHGSRDELRPLPPRPEVVPNEPAAGVSLRFAWGESQEGRRVVRAASSLRLGSSGGEPEREEDDDDLGAAMASRPFSGLRARLVSDWMSSPERARRDFETRLREQISRWLTDSGVDPDWTVPDRLLAGLRLPVELEEQDRDYGRLYRVSANLEFTDDQRSRFVREYDRQVAEKRLGILGGLLGFVLVSLGVTTAYVRADEASRGYYTNRLRLLAAVAVGATGVLLIRWLGQG